MKKVAIIFLMVLFFSSNVFSSDQDVDLNKRTLEEENWLINSQIESDDKRWDSMTDSQRFAALRKLLRRESLKRQMGIKEDA